MLLQNKLFVVKFNYRSKAKIRQSNILQSNEISKKNSVIINKNRVLFSILLLLKLNLHTLRSLVSHAITKIKKANLVLLI